MLGIQPNLPPEELEKFDPIDNDYFRIVVYDRDLSEENLKRGGMPNYHRISSDFDLERCSEQTYHDLVVPNMRQFFPNGLCFKSPHKVSFRGNFALESNNNKYLTILACDPSKRSTCKTRRETGLLLSDTNFFVIS